MTPQEIGLQILESLVQDLRLRPGHVVPDMALAQAFEKRGGHRDDIKTGLRFAHERGWLEYHSSKDHFTLTEAGHTVASSAGRDRVEPYNDFT